MKIFAAILLVVACANANSIHRYGWTAGMESVFRFESQVLTSIPEIKQSQMAGLKIMANVRVQALQDYTLRVKIDNAQLVTLNGEIDLTDANRIVENGGANSDSLHDNFPPEFKRHLETPVLVNLKRGVVEEFFVAQDEPMSVTNIKRSLLSQLQLDISGSQQTISRQGSYHKVLEESVLGKCYTMYNVIPLTPARVMELERSWYDEESRAKLQHSDEGKKACENKQYYEIIKTRDLDHCTFRPMFQHVGGAEFNGDASKSRVGNLMTHMSSSTIYVCGELSSFNIRKIIVDDQIVANPIGLNTEQTEKTRTRIMLELIKKVAISSKLPAPTASRKETTLVYTYPEQRELESQLSAEVVQNTQQILGTRPVLPQPKLEEAPKSLIPTGVPNSQIISQIVHEMITIAKKVYESPESCTQELDISGRIQTISKLMQVLSLQEIEQVWTKTLAAVPEPSKKAAKYLIIDTAAMAGTNPATMFVFKKIDAAQICFIKATATIQTAMKSIRTPTKELVTEILRMVKQWKNDSNQEKKKLLTPTVLQLSNLIYHAYVNPSTMVSNFPVRIYGIFGTEHSPVVNEYVSFLKQWLEQTEQDPKRVMKPVIVTALGKLGLLDAVKPILKVAQGVNQEEPMYRSLAVHSLKRASVRYPRAMKAVLLAIINNPVEHADVRIAAISILPWAQPSYVELQQIAIRSWYDRSNHVSSYARSTLMSLIHSEVPELKEVAAKARTVIHLFKPVHYGFQLAKNFQISQFVRYLLSSANTEIQVVQTKDNLGPSKVSVASDVIMEVLGEGLRIKMDSWSVYSQGLDTVIDHALKLRAVFGDVLTTSPMVDEELKKMAEQIKLNPKDLSQYKSFIQSHNLGYEYAVQLTVEQIVKLISELKQSNIKDDLARGVKADFVTSANLLFAEFLGPNELGLPMIARKDLVSVLAAKGYAQTEPQGYGMKAGLIPVWNIKQQSDAGIVAPFKICSECSVNGFAGQGVSVSLHTSLPIEVTARVSIGELEIELKAPEQSVASRTNHEVVHALVTPYTVRAPWATVVPLNKAQNAKEILSGSPKKTFSKHFNGLFNGQFIYESDNEFVDLYSYLEKIRQHSPLSLPMTLPLVSSVRKSSARLEINAAMSELKQATLKIKLFTQKPSELMNLISKPVEQTILQEIKSIPSLNTVHSMLPHSPATIIKVEAAIKKGSEVKAVEGYAVVGYKQVANHQVKSVAAVAGKLKQAYTTYGILYEGELKRPLISARWNKEKILAQNLELVYNGALTYGPENNQQGKEKIAIATRFYKTAEQIKSVQESPEFKKCQEEERAGRRLSPICVKVRNQAASLDRAEMEIRLPNTIYQSPVLSTIEDFVKATLFAHYKQTDSVAQLPKGQIKLDFAFARAGDLAHIVVKHSHEAYKLTSIRIPRVAQGVMPLAVRNPVVDVMEQKFTNKYAPASCRVEPSLIRTFDNRTYAYKINECEHVLLTDGQRILPVAVLTKTISGDQKMVKILSGKTKVEIIPQSGSLKILVDGQPQSINQGTTFVKKCSQTGDIIAEIRRYVDDVYHVFAPLQMMHVMTDGKSVEVIAPQLLKNRAIGLCGDMNGEEIADLSTPKRCIMQPKLVAISYMLNRNGDDAKFAQCHNIEPQDLAAYQREDQKCAKEEIVKTPVLAIFERIQRMTLGQEGGAGGLGGGYGSELGSGVQGHPCMMYQCSFCEIRGRETKINFHGMDNLDECKSWCLTKSWCTGIDYGKFGECYLNFDDVRVVGTKTKLWFTAYRKEPNCNNANLGAINTYQQEGESCGMGVEKNHGQCRPDLECVFGAMELIGTCQVKRQHADCSMFNDEGFDETHGAICKGNTNKALNDVFDVQFQEENLSNCKKFCNCQKECKGFNFNPNSNKRKCSWKTDSPVETFTNAGIQRSGQSCVIKGLQLENGEESLVGGYGSGAQNGGYGMGGGYESGSGRDAFEMRGVYGSGLEGSSIGGSYGMGGGYRSEAGNGANGMEVGYGSGVMDGDFGYGAGKGSHGIGGHEGGRHHGMGGGYGRGSESGVGGHRGGYGSEFGTGAQGGFMDAPGCEYAPTSECGDPNFRLRCPIRCSQRLGSEGRQVQNGEETLVGGSGRMGEYNVKDGGFEYGAHGMKRGYGAGSEGGTGGLEVGPRSGFGSPEDFNSGRHLGGSCPEGLNKCYANCNHWFDDGPDDEEDLWKCQDLCKANCK